MNSEHIKVTFPGGKKVDAKIGDFTISTDQSIKYGGDGAAPEPFDFFLASIATCAGVFALSFCKSRNLPTQGMDLTMECDRDDKKKLITRMIIRLTLPDDFPEKYRTGVERAMGLCSVKRHILEAPEFVIETVSSS